MTTIALLAVSIFAIPGGNTAIAAKSNCTSVNKTYPFGIALNKQSIGTSKAIVNRAKYFQLTYLDKDLDGIVCEIEKLQTKVTIPATIPATTTTITRQVCVSGGACSVGDRGPGGGIVFYDAGSTQTWGRYLEAAPTDLACNCTWSEAFDVMKSYTNGGLSDWRIPTIDELNLLFLNRAFVGGFSNSYYRSSTETTASGAWEREMFTYGKILNGHKLNNSRVRPIRGF